MSAEVPITGFTTSIREYNRVEGIILRPAEAIVKYGTLVVLHDATQNREYLAMLTRVEEETPHPALDVERLRKIYQAITEASLEEANRVLMELLSPTQRLIKWSSIMRVELRVLGEIRRTGGRERLEAYDRPPRPFSSIREPSPERLERIIHSSLGDDYRLKGIYLGRLSLMESVRVYMNPARLNTHLSILAQTGGGKTETVKRLVYEISRRRRHLERPEGGIIVFDIAGEYTGHPYYPPDSVPLLDAVLDPEEHEGGEQVPSPSRPGRITIIVPYEASHVGRSQVEQLLAKGLEELACRLAARLGREIDVLAFLTMEKRSGRASPGCRSLRLSKIGYDAAYRLLRDSPFLIVAMPLPNFMDIDTMVEISGTRSEFFPLIVSDIANTLDLYHGTDVYGIGLLVEITNLVLEQGASIVQPRQRRPGERPSIPLLEVYERRCQAGDWGPPDTRKDKIHVRRELFYHFMRYLAWRAYRQGIADPSQDSETRALCKFLADPEALRSLEEELRDLARLVSTLKKEYTPSVASAKRALRKIHNMVSDILDTILFDAAMARLMEGFSIVHLAPPSSGNVDQLLGLLIKRLFQLHVGNYRRGRLTVLVVEEAHNLAPAGVDKASKRSLLRVAREGRKWGLSLWLVTQRPSFVDSDLLSQTATSILLRTTNPEDLSTIRRSVESAAAEIVERLPELEPSRGEALLAGLAAPERKIPLLVYVEKLSRKSL